ncbi:MAG: ABC transporter ATP-binding protein [Nitrolancea sp.]
MSDEEARRPAPQQPDDVVADPFSPELKPATDEDARWRPKTRRDDSAAQATPSTPPEFKPDVEENESDELRWRPPERRTQPAPREQTTRTSDRPSERRTDGEHWRPPVQDERPVETRARLYESPVAGPEHWGERVRQSISVLDPIVSTDSLSRNYPVGESIVHALKATTLLVDRGHLVAVHGRSGSGKTTMLNLIGGLDRPSDGRVWIDGVEVTSLPESELVNLRRYKIGFIFQTFGLIPILSAAENVEVPLRLAHVDVNEREERVRVLLELVGLGERARHRPHELSGGEQQRVAIARALANSPRLLIADEPTGQLDSGTGRTIMTLIRALVKSEGVTAIVATHDPLLIDLADRIIELRDGEIIDDTAAPPKRD